MVVRMRQRRLRDRFVTCSSAGLLAAGLVVGSAGSASAATTVTISAPTVAVSAVWIQGAVSGSSSGATLRILKNTGGTWTVAATTTVKPDRKYIVKVPLTAGANTLLAKASKAGLATGYSKSVKVYGVTHRGMILYQTNVQRKKYGLPELKGLTTLNKVAQDWTQKIFTEDCDLSTDPNGCHNPNYFGQYSGTPQAGAENVASGLGNGLTSSNVVAAWMNSPGHRANILGPYNHIGIGWVSEPGGKAYATQNFARY
jgi:uncharacterized protein YkwD